MSKIVSVEATTVVVPLDKPMKFATRSVTDRVYTLVRVTGDTGHVGIGFCYTGNFGGTFVADAVRGLIAPIVVGQDSFRVKGIWDDVYSQTLLHGRAGSVTRAQSAVDIAIWDLNARSLGLPLWKFLGTVHETSVPAYASGGYYADGKGDAEVAAEMASYVSAGFQAVKMKVGRGSIAAERARLGAVRAAVGDDVIVMLDANNAWRDYPTALGYMNAFEDFNPYWIEEPFSPDDIGNHARLAARTSIPVATGEIEAGRWRHFQLLSAEGASILQTDAAVCGGITEFQRIAATADSFGITVSPHWFHDLHIHLVASTSNARYVEFFPDSSVLNFRRLLTEQLQTDGKGGLLLPDRPGLGFDFDKETVAKYGVEEWR